MRHVAAINESQQEWYVIAELVQHVVAQIAVFCFFGSRGIALKFPPTLLVEETGLRNGRALAFYSASSNLCEARVLWRHFGAHGVTAC